MTESRRPAGPSSPPPRRKLDPDWAPRTWWRIGFHAAVVLAFVVFAVTGSLYGTGWGGLFGYGLWLVPAVVAGWFAFSFIWWRPARRSARRPVGVLGGLRGRPAPRLAGRRPQATPVIVHPPVPPTYYPGRPAPVDWPGFIASVAIRIEDALGPGFFAHGYGMALFLSHADDTRRIDLAPLLRPIAVDSAALAMQACVKMLDAAQMFKMAELRQPWPRRPHLDDSSPPVSLARPRVHLEDLEVHMAFVDELGPVLQLPSLPFVEGHPEPDGPIRRT
ncbi:MAG TPA: hypothetical protein VFN50_13040 [Acidimicrobiales bacterium]|nr:hypothetical protein [Acidimicrobiales bacterium]